MNRNNDVNNEKFQRIVVERSLKLRDDKAPKSDFRILLRRVSR